MPECVACFLKSFQGYKLVITGHSLGAGTATVLSILLRPTYPNLMCFAFSPPGGLVRYTAFLLL